MNVCISVNACVCMHALCVCVCMCVCVYAHAGHHKRVNGGAVFVCLFLFFLF